jgi:hypothetical protein
VANIIQCKALVEAGLEGQVFLRTDSGYEQVVETWWANNVRLQPWCFVLPRSAVDVSLALTTLLNLDDVGDWHLALRSGGHSMAGNNIEKGVTIDLSMMNSSYYNIDTGTARIEPGGRWGKVYADLQTQNVTVAGGRDGDVGVGGFLTGGGLSFFTPRKGFGCDSVVNYEVVLANGSIVNANASAHSDLWKALKGGSGNFGIVTRYDMNAIPSPILSHDLRFLAATETNSRIVMDTVIDFANHPEPLGDNALVTFWMHNTTLAKDTVIGTIYVNTVGDTHVETSYSNVKNLTPILNRTTSDTMAEAALGSQVAGGTWYVRPLNTRNIRLTLLNSTTGMPRPHTL